MKTQLEFLKLTVRLAEANPNTKIKFFTSCEELLDDCAWVEHQITSVSVEDYYLHNDERILIDEDDIRNAIAERFEDDVEHTDEEIEKKIDEIYKEEVTQVIAVYVGYTGFENRS